MGPAILFFAVIWYLISSGGRGLNLGVWTGLAAGVLFFIFMIPSGALAAIAGGIVVTCCVAF